METIVSAKLQEACGQPAVAEFDETKKILDAAGIKPQ